MRSCNPQAWCDERIGVLEEFLFVGVEQVPDFLLEEIRLEMPFMLPRPTQTPMTPILNRFLGNSLFVGAVPLVSLELLTTFRIKWIVTCTEHTTTVPDDCRVFDFPATFAAGESSRLGLEKNSFVSFLAGKLVGPRRSLRGNCWGLGETCGETCWGLPNPSPNPSPSRMPVQVNHYVNIAISDEAEGRDMSKTIFIRSLRSLILVIDHSDTHVLVGCKQGYNRSTGLCAALLMCAGDPVTKANARGFTKRTKKENGEEKERGS